jgi:hypothetical protein
MKALNKILESVAEKKKQLDALGPLPKALVNNLQQRILLYNLYNE